MIFSHLHWNQTPWSGLLSLPTHILPDSRIAIFSRCSPCDPRQRNQRPHLWSLDFSSFRYLSCTPKTIGSRFFLTCFGRFSKSVSQFRNSLYQKSERKVPKAITFQWLRWSQSRFSQRWGPSIVEEIGSSGEKSKSSSHNK